MNLKPRLEYSEKEKWVNTIAADVLSPMRNDFD